MAEPRKDIERFVRQQLFRVRENPVEKMQLRNAAQGSKGATVEDFPIPEEFNNDHVGILVDEILQRAQMDADGLGTKLQRYILVALEPGRKDGPRLPFKVRGEGDEEEEGGEDPPTEKGLTSQLMRHNEALMRMLVMTTGTQVGAMARQLEQKDKLIENLHTQREKDREAVEESKTMQHERDMQLLLTEGQEERKNALLKKVEALIPVVMAKMTGKEVAPTGPIGDVFKTLADSLTTEQLQAIAPMLTSEQQIQLVTLLQAAKRASQKQGGGEPS